MTRRERGSLFRSGDRRLSLIIVVAALAVVIPSAPAEAQSIRLVTRVIDGDTLVLDGGERVRLIGVDTPETVHPGKTVERFGKEASQFTRQLVEGKEVRIEYDAETAIHDRYGRTLAYVYLSDGSLLNLEIIEQGYGHAYTRFPFSKMEQFREAEREAREAQRGLWAEKRDGKAARQRGVCHPNQGGEPCGS